MSVKIGIRKEDKNKWERRVPLTPQHIKTLITRGLEVVVQPSAQRIFPNHAYTQVGAHVDDDLADCRVIFAVKEIPPENLLPKHTYIYFSHTIKGQAHNMPMLQKLLDLKCTLIDYERVTDDNGKRLFFFGHYAGSAGMIDSLWALGKRLEHEGITTPFSRVCLSYEYNDFQAAKIAIQEIGKQIKDQGLPQNLIPLVIGFTGYGNVSQGAQEVFDLLPHKQIHPHELSQAMLDKSTHQLLKVVFREEHMAVLRKNRRFFDLQEYYQHPERYRGVFAGYVPYLSVLVNCIYWTPMHPRLVTRDLLHGLYGAGHRPKLRVIGDISCDIEGSIECTLKSTDSGNPVYTYLPDKDEIVDGVKGDGPVVLAVDNLPCEFPSNASCDFGDALMLFVEVIARADYSASFEQLDLPKHIKRAVIAHQGKLAPDYAYLEKHIEKIGGEF